MVVAATLICGSIVLTSCTNEDNPATPLEEPLPKVSKIYSTRKVKAEKNVAGQWIILYEKDNERSLSVDIQWAGDRMESIKTSEGLWSLTYDNKQRVTSAKSNKSRLNFAYEYDPQGRLARMVKTVPYNDVIDHIFTATYSYNGDKLVKTESTNVITGEVEVSQSVPVKEVTGYEWQGDNVASMTIEQDLLDGSHNTEYITFEYTTLLNPFYHDILFQTGLYSVAGIGDDGSGISKNLLKTYTRGVVVYNYEYTTNGDRVVSVTSDHESETPTMRVSTHAVYDLEYAE